MLNSYQCKAFLKFTNELTKSVIIGITFCLRNKRLDPSFFLIVVLRENANKQLVKDNLNFYDLMTKTNIDQLFT